VKSVAVFCGAASGSRPVFADAAAALGVACAQQDLKIVFGGGHIGLMGVVADAALAAGGEVVGVIPRDLQERELAHGRLTQIHVVDGMHERKALMGALADAFIALPGGFGTLEELFEVVTWSQLRFHNKPIALLNTAGYFDSLLSFVHHAITTGFIDAQDRTLLRVASEPEDTLAALRQPPAGERSERP